MTTEQKKRALYVLLGLGFASLFAAREWPQQDAQGVVPFILAVLGTLCFIGAGMMARRLLRGPRN